MEKANFIIQIHVLGYCRTELTRWEFSTIRAAEYIFSVNASGTAKYTHRARQVTPNNNSTLG
jgi:hypothetical protein